MNSVRNLFNAKTRMVMAGTAGVMAVGAVVLAGSTAEFSDSTSNNDNTWASGEVVLENNRTSAAFTASNIEPGYTESQCITVTSDSTVPVDLTMYAANLLPSTLGSQLEVTIEEGTGGVQGTNATTSRGDCTGFTADATVYTGTLAGFGAFTNYDQGLGDTVVAPAGSKQYKITASLPSTAGNDVAAQNTGIDFVWEAKSRA